MCECGHETPDSGTTMHETCESPEAGPTCREAVLNCVEYYDEGDGVPRWRIFKSAYTFDRDDVAWAIEMLLYSQCLKRTGDGSLVLSDRGAAAVDDSVKRDA